MTTRIINNKSRARRLSLGHHSNTTASINGKKENENSFNALWTLIMKYLK
jgi:hypothetical protein